jgi:hypothetical protein
LVTIEEIQATYYMVAATGVLVAAAYYILNLRVSQRNQEISLKNQELSQKTQELMLKAQEQTLETRQVQLFMQYFNFWMSPGYLEKFVELLNQQWSDFDDYMEKYGYGNNPSGFQAYATIENYYGGLGLLVRRGLVDPHLVHDLMDTDIINYWDKMRPILEGMRRDKKLATWGENSEYLYNVVSKIYREKHPNLVA